MNGYLNINPNNYLRNLYYKFRELRIFNVLIFYVLIFYVLIFYVLFVSM